MENQILNFNDIFKSSFVEKISSVSFIDIIIALLMSFAIGLFIGFGTRKPPLFISEDELCL